MTKRLIELLFAVLLLIVLAPLLAMVALMIKLDSKGPVLHRARRLGKDGRPFIMYKFRTMFYNPTYRGPNLTRKYDPRVTHIGQFLRYTKIDEFPQLFNVLKDEMTFVGPRPEYVEHLKYFTEEERQILTLKPGLTGLAQIQMHHEEDVLADVDDVDEYYLSKQFHEKLAIDMEYLRRRSFLFDAYLVCKTIGTLVNALFHFDVLRRRPKRTLLFLSDIGLVGLSYYGAFVLRYDWPLPPHISAIFWKMLPAVLIIRGFCFLYFGLYRGLVYYFSITDVLNLAKAVGASSVLIVVSTFFMHILGHPRTVFILDILLVFILMGSVRFTIRATRLYRARHWMGHRRALLAGPVELTEPILRQRQYLEANHYEIVGLIDTTDEHIGRSVHGVKIIGSCDRLLDAAQLMEAQAIIIVDTPLGRTKGNQRREELHGEGIDLIYTSELHMAVGSSSEEYSSSEHPTTPSLHP